ncbi:MAG: OB-fold nucleic acid binding domain-containing protein, partial [Deltaproteobacteria bacterium]
MEWITLDRIADYAGQTVELRGWVANRRSSGKISFLELRDGPGVIQCVVMSDHVSPEAFNLAKSIPYESSVVVRGRVEEDSRAPSGFEIRVDELEL